MVILHQNRNRRQQSRPVEKKTWTAGGWCCTVARCRSWGGSLISSWRLTLYSGTVWCRIGIACRQCLGGLLLLTSWQPL